MSVELRKRIITSIILFSLVIFCVFINWPIYIFFIIIVSGIALVEINKLIWLIDKLIQQIEQKNISNCYFSFS